MIDAVVEFLKHTARLSSITFLCAALGAGVVLAFWRRTSRVARWYFLALFGGFWLLSTPACAERMIRTVSAEGGRIETAADARGARTIVVLGSGSVTYRAGDITVAEPSPPAILRLMEAARVYRLLERPTVILSGGVTDPSPGARPESEAMRDVARRVGIPDDRIALEDRSKNTRDEAIEIRRMLGAESADPIVLVTSPTHMGRSLRTFRAAGLHPIPSVAPYKSDGTMESWRWLPANGGLWLSDVAIYDAAAVLYYRLRGWGRSPDIQR